MAATKKTPSIIAESTPASQATITTPEMMIDIHFTTKIDPHHSRLTLLLPNGRQLNLVSLAGAPDHLSARASNLTPGDYTLRWQVVPVGKWSCAEWYFDGQSNQMKFWLDGSEVSSVDIDGKGAGCTGVDAKDVPDYPWMAPTFSTHAT